MKYETRIKINKLGLFECSECLGWFELDDLIQWDDQNICDYCMEDKENEPKQPTEKQIRNVKIGCVLIPVIVIGLVIMNYFSDDSHA
jgi:hypothetical protein